MRGAKGPGRKLWPRRNRMARVARETGDRMTSQDPLVAAATRIAAHLGKVLDVPAAIRLWDGTIVPLGSGDHGGRMITIAGPGVLGTLVVQVGSGPFLDGVRGVDGGALAAALALGSLTTVGCAWRWRFSAISEL